MSSSTSANLNFVGDPQYDHVLSRLRRMRKRESDNTVDRSNAFERIRHMVAISRVSVIRAKAKWTIVKETSDMFQNTVTRHLTGEEKKPWAVAEERVRFSKMEFRHNSNLPGTEFDQYDREAMEKWLKTVDPIASEGKTTREMRRIADAYVHQNNHGVDPNTVFAMPGPIDESADRHIREQLQRANAPQPADVVETVQIADVMIAGEPIDVSPEDDLAQDALAQDALAQQAASIVQSINTVVQSP